MVGKEKIKSHKAGVALAAKTLLCNRFTRRTIRSADGSGTIMPFNTLSSTMDNIRSCCFVYPSHSIDRDTCLIYTLQSPAST